MRPSIGDRAIARFEALIIALLQLLLVLAVLAGTVHLFLIFFRRLPSTFTEIRTAGELHPVMQNAFGGVLVVVLGLELIETLKVYFREHRVRLEVIMIVSLIAVGRHIIQVDYAHVSGLQLVGLAAIILSLAGGYFLIARSHGHSKPQDG